MRLKLIPCLALFVAISLTQGSHGQMLIEVDDSFTPMDFDEAAQMLESSTQESYALWIDQLSELLGEYELSYSNLVSGVQQNPELQARLMQTQKSSDKIAQRTSRAVLSMLDPLNRDRLADYLASADTLPVLSLLMHAYRYEMYGSSAEDSEFSPDSLSETVARSPRLQTRLVELMFDERSVLTLAMPDDKKHLVANLFDQQGSGDWDYQVGQQALYPAVQLLPQTTLTRELGRATRPDQLDRLPDYLEKMILGGALSYADKLPFAWLVEQIEAGSLIWLNHLTLTSEGRDHPLLFEHFDRLDRSQQLNLIAISPRAEFLPVLRDAWQEAVDAAWCDGCAEAVDNTQVENLLQALMTWQTDESAEMLGVLMGIESYSEIMETWSPMIVMSAMQSGSDAFVRLGMNMAQQDVSVPVYAWALNRLHQFDADGLKEIVKSRVDYWSGESDAVQYMPSWGGFNCDLSALGLYAEGQGLSVDWRQWMPVGEEISGAMEQGCLYPLSMAALADPDATAPLLALLAEMEAIEASEDHYDNLVSLARYQTEPSQEQRDLLAAALIDHPAWDSLSQRLQDWLLGIETPRKSRLSCESNKPLTEAINDD